MFSSVNLNENMLNNALFFEKTKCKNSLIIRLRRLGALHPDPHDFTHTYCTATKCSNFVAHKTILISQIWGNFSAPFSL